MEAREPHMATRATSLATYQNASRLQSHRTVTAHDITLAGGSLAPENNNKWTRL